MLIVRGLPDHLRREAAQVYWQAFGGKLGRVMGPDARALAFLERAINPRQALVALDDDGSLLGLAGFKTPEGGFVDGTFGMMRRVYGTWGALWRGFALHLLSREVDNRRFLMDGICVTRAARGRGVGTALIAGIVGLARAGDYPEVRLDVIDTNLRARALYERLGFLPVRTERLGILRHVFGFEAATTMIRGV